MKLFTFLITVLLLVTTPGKSLLAQRTTDPDCSKDSDYRLQQGCEPSVLVIRHAEDAGDGGEHYLTPQGQNHAELYVTLFDKYVYGKSHTVNNTEVCVCPVGKIIAIDPKPNKVNPNPSSNPYETIKPFAKSIDLDILVKDGKEEPYSTAYEWKTERRKSLLADKNQSTVIAWDKAGLNPSEEEIKKAQGYGLNLYHKPLLKKLAKNFTLDDEDHFTPQRSHFFVFAKQNQDSGKFSVFKTYTQHYSVDGSDWFTTTKLKDSDPTPTMVKLKK